MPPLGDHSPKEIPFGESPSLRAAGYPESHLETAAPSASPPAGTLAPKCPAVAPGRSSPPPRIKKCPQSHIISAYSLPSWLPGR